MPMPSPRSAVAPQQQIEDLVPGTEAEQPPRHRRRPVFRRNADMPMLARDEAERQGRIVGRACHWLGNGPAALAFLNQHNEQLNGRPIDIAIASPVGFDAVESVLSAIGPCALDK